MTMDFQRGRAKEDPEINLIPMIDVLLVILIFLMVTTTFSQFAELQINLPTAEAEQAGRQARCHQRGGGCRRALPGQQFGRG